MSRETLLDEAIAKAKDAEDWQLVGWLRMARGCESAAKWYTEKLRGLEDENARLRSCLSDDAENARMIMGENVKLRELVRHLRECTRHNVCAVCEYADDACDFDYDMRELGIEVEQ